MSQAAQTSIGGGRYELLRPIASGGMGRIWEARDTRLDRIVAIKEVLLDRIPQAEHDEFVARAVQEGRNAAALAGHPNIVAVYDVVVEGGVPWTVMQRVHGRSLAEVVKPGPMPEAEAAVLAEEMLSALGHAHASGIVHRDVKPLNILIEDGSGRALLADFGIAKNSKATSFTQTGVVIGSASYMAPERQEGESGTAASDLFSLGVTLFEAVEGYSPFAKGSRTGTVNAILIAPLPQMQRAERLAPLIVELTHKDQFQRPTVADALARLHGTPPPPPSQAPPNQSPPAPAAPWPAPVPHVWFHSGALGVPGHATPSRCLRFSPDGSLLASGGKDGTLRLWEVATGALLGSVSAHADEVLSAAFSPDGLVIASGGKDKTLRMWDVATGSLITALFTERSPQRVSALAFSPDGGTLAGVGVKQLGSLLWLWRHAQGTMSTTLASIPRQSSCVAFSPDGRVLAMGGTYANGGSVDLWDYWSGAAVGTFRQRGIEAIGSLAFSADGRTVTGVSDGLTATEIRWDVPTGGKLMKELVFPQPMIAGATSYGLRSMFGAGTGLHTAFSQDGQTFVVPAGRRIRVCRTTDSGTLATLPVPGLSGGQIVQSVAISPGGQVIAASSSDGVIRVWRAPGVAY